MQRKGAALPAVPRPPAPAPPVRAVQRKLPEKAPVHAPAPGTPAARVLQAAKIKDLPNYKKLDLCQSYTAKYYNYGTSRYVMLNFAAAAGWHITFFPGNPASDPYQEDVLTNFMNEDNTGDYRWRQNYDQIGELDYKEFHVTTGELHRGTAKHFFYREDGSFLREEGAGITDADRKMADMLRATIVPAARVGAYQAPVAAAAAAVPAAAAPAAPQQLWYQNPHVVAAMVDAPVPLGSSLKDRLKRLDGSS